MEDWICDIEDGVAEDTQSEQQQESRILKRDSLRKLWDNIKSNKISIIGLPEGEERKQEVENVYEEIMTENFPNLVRKIDIQPQEVQRIPNKMNPKRPMSRYIIIKMPKVKFKERILKAAREKWLVTYKGVHIRLSVDFSKETVQARRAWHEIVKSD